MRSLFWRIFASFWLAITLVAGLSMLLGRALNQDSWILNNTPALQGIAETWTERYESAGKLPAQAFLRQHKDQYQVDVQVLGENGQQLVPGTFPPRAAAFESRQKNKRLPWRRLTTEYVSPSTDKTYLFIYRIPYQVLNGWHRDSLLWPISALVIALVVLTVFSLLLTLSITRPLNRLRGAVHDLGQTSYQQNSLAHLSKRRDELGLLASDFNRMGARLQGLIGSQRQLLRDVSHELRSPLARLRIAIALAERATPEEREKLWPRLTKECDRLEALISEILELARLDANLGAVQPVKLEEILQKLVEYVQISAPAQQVDIRIAPGLKLDGWPIMLERALDNLLRNALRFNPPGQPIEVKAQAKDGAVVISVRDHGPGVDEQYLKQLGEPFFRAPGQTAAGHGLGLAIARRAAERHGGKLVLANDAQGGFCASLMITTQTEAKS